MQRLVLCLDQSPGVWQQHDPGWGQTHLPGVSFEQLKANFAFEGLDALRESGLGQMQADGRVSEMA